ncbi:helix-turn-helix domain-containing protein [Micromonospora sp. 4G57]|uniref:Helix-turn-helix domain-containing protein n=1 Tax=Micromonospora sicca TaxID=2202420 RepID=A0ABU5JLV7_9ACTN|nr:MULTISPECIES: helix-turn-helix domain-containing protein [unclassified Micromonospora]MDZ5446893.1 helix-turn-helix domain-containing protein [Micromonospora sp. 4G57]MDZ5493571.1 helix-turn-helix domain-containing protein [Micromonospora sp. 4G53]
MPSNPSRSRRRLPPPAPSPAHADDHSDDQGPRLYTPAEAAALLRVPESWLRRRAGRRQIPRTFLGKHLRFSAADLAADLAAAAEPATGRRRPRRPRSPSAADLPPPRSHASITAAPQSNRSE